MCDYRNMRKLSATWATIHAGVLQCNEVTVHIVIFVIEIYLIVVFLVIRIRNIRTIAADAETLRS